MLSVHAFLHTYYYYLACYYHALSDPVSGCLQELRQGRLVLGHLLGKGAYASVHAATFDGVEVAVKVGLDYAMYD